MARNSNSSLSKLCVSLIVFIGGISQVSAACSVPPIYWCDNTVVATECGVVEQCAHYAQSTYKRPVDLVLYYESMCPDCSEFFKDQLREVYNKLGSIVNITLVPFGNAVANFDEDTQLYRFTCQHGHRECHGNLIETCAINLLEDISVYFPFIYCMETADSSTPLEAAFRCAKENAIDLEPILECSKSRFGNQLEHQMAVKTEALRPRHTSVPWVTINGIYTNRLQRWAVSALGPLVCDTYRGPSKPNVCD